MFKAVIAGYSRSPFTMARKGELIDIKPVNMLAEVIKSLTTKSKINKQILTLNYNKIVIKLSYTMYSLLWTLYVNYVNPVNYVNYINY